ncbi:MAG: pyridoxamine 5'-phosphate oxidase family protein [Pseudomonadota bacterium]
MVEQRSGQSVRKPAALTEESQIEASIGRRSKSVDMKVIDHLDPLALQWLNHAALGMIALAREGDIDAVLCRGGGLDTSAGELRVPLASLDETRAVAVGAAFGSLWAIPGLRETLRVNGTIIERSATQLTVRVRECYAHCGKALIRSDFWTPGATDRAPVALEEHLGAARFIALATVNDRGEADLSPKGDPAGTLVQLGDGVLSFADRPGNRRADSLRNLLARPAAALLLIAPGSATVATFRGTAQIFKDLALREHFAVQGKVPGLVVALDDLSMGVGQSQALLNAGLWPAPAAPAEIEPAAVFAAHVRLNKAASISQRVARALASSPGLMKKGLDQDYKKNLY